jgi:hypothetical protein
MEEDKKGSEHSVPAKKTEPQGGEPQPQQARWTIEFNEDSKRLGREVETVSTNT